MTSPNRSSGTRRSFGGRVVEDSLDRVGFDLSPDVHIVVTARPSISGGGTVLVQNAWNFLADAEFDELSRPYPRVVEQATDPGTPAPPDADTLRASSVALGTTLGLPRREVVA